MHVDFVRHLAALAKIAWAASCNDVFPACLTAARSRDDMIEGQIIRRVTIDAGKPIAQEDIETRERWRAVLPDKFAEADDTR